MDLINETQEMIAVTCKEEPCAQSSEVITNEELLPNFYREGIRIKEVTTLENSVDVDLLEVKTEIDSKSKTNIEEIYLNSFENDPLATTSDINNILPKNSQLVEDIEKNFYKCHFCNYKSVIKSNLVSHMLIHTAKKLFACDVCNYKSNRKANLAEHMRIHTGEKLKCHLCNFQTAYKSSLDGHVKTHTRENNRIGNLYYNKLVKPYENFNDDIQPNSNINKDSRELPGVNMKMGVSVVQEVGSSQRTGNIEEIYVKSLQNIPTDPIKKVDLYAGKKLDRYHTPALAQNNSIEKSSELCDSKSIDNELKDKHVLLPEVKTKSILQEVESTQETCSIQDIPTSTTVEEVDALTDSQFRCRVCKYTTSKNSNFLKHIATHTTEKPHKCNFCNFKTAHKSSLIAHLKRHTRKKAFECKICDYKCTLQSQLIDHMLYDKHEKLFECHICDYKCSVKLDLVNHVLTHTDVQPLKDKQGPSEVNTASCVSNRRFNSTCKTSIEALFLNNSQNIPTLIVEEINPDTDQNNTPNLMEPVKQSASSNTEQKPLKVYDLHMVEETWKEEPVEPPEVKIETSATVLEDNNFTHTVKSLQNIPTDPMKEVDFYAGKKLDRYHTPALAQNNSIEKSSELCDSKSIDNVLKDKHVLLPEVKTKSILQEDESTQATCSIQSIPNFSNFETAHKSSLTAHLKSHTRKKAFECKICDYKCTLQSQLIDHMLYDKHEKLFECHICDYKCSVQIDLVNHVLAHTDVQPLKDKQGPSEVNTASCVSKRRFNSTCKTSIEALFLNSSQNIPTDPMKEVDLHAGNNLDRYHTPALAQNNSIEKSSELCDSKSIDNVLKDKHVLLPEGKTKSILQEGESAHATCSIQSIPNFSNFETAHRSSLTAHLKSHTRKKAFECKICDYKCTLQTQLIDHMLYDKHEKLFECHICDYKCSVKIDLVNHVLAHTDVQPLKDKQGPSEVNTVSCVSKRRFNSTCKTSIEPIFLNNSQNIPTLIVEEINPDTDQKHTPNLMELVKESPSNTEELKPLKVYDFHMVEETWKEEPVEPPEVKIETSATVLEENNFTHTAAKSEEIYFDSNSFENIPAAIVNDETHTEKVPQTCNYNATRNELLVDTDKILCYICGFKFSKANLVSHMRIHTGEKPFACNLCDYKTNRNAHLVDHMRYHTGDNLFTCHICNYKTIRKGDLLKHTQRKHEGNKFQCDKKKYKCQICDYAGYQKSSLINHMRVHTGEKPYECHICKLQFAQNASLIGHMRCHTNEKPFKCHLCKYRSRQKNTLVDHIRTHTGEKPYQCHICDKRCCVKSQLVVHLRFHARQGIDIGSTKLSECVEKKLYECYLCKCKISSKANLARHIRIHTGEKPYDCHICSKKYSVKSQLVKHLQFHAREGLDMGNIELLECVKKSPLVEDKNIFECYLCKYKSNTKVNLVRHMQIHTALKPFKCEMCNYRSNRKARLLKHMRIHTGDR